MVLQGVSGPARDRVVRAVYLPAAGAVEGVAWLEVSASAAEAAGGAWTLTVYPAGPEPPRRTPLTAEALRAVVRQWGREARRGRGRMWLG